MMSELPLTLFTTFGSIAAGAMILLALAFATTQFSEAQLKKIDQLTAIPAVVLLVAFICAFFHLGNAGAAFGVFSNIGSSPLSNELLAAVIFAVVALVYWIMALTGKLAEGARKGFSLVVAVLAVVFALFMGMAYMMSTITSWNTPLVPVQMIGLALASGAALGIMVLKLAGALDAAVAGSFKTAALAVVVIGAALAVIGIAGQMALTNGLMNPFYTGSDLVSAVMVPAVAGIICLVVAAVLDIMALKSQSAALIYLAVVLALVGVFCIRWAFYGLQISVGLAVML